MIKDNMKNPNILSQMISYIDDNPAKISKAQRPLWTIISARAQKTDNLSIDEFGGGFVILDQKDIKLGLKSFHDDVDDDLFRHWVSRLNGDLDSICTEINQPKVSISLKKNGEFHISWYSAPEEHVMASNDKAAQMDDENFVQSDYCGFLDEKLMQNPIKLIISHNHKNNDVEKIKDDFVKNFTDKMLNLPEKYNDLQFEILYDKEHLNGTERFTKITEEGASQSLIGLFLISDGFLNSKDCGKELKFFWDRKQKKDKPGRIVIFNQFKDDFEKDEFPQCPNDIQLYAHNKLRENHKNLLSFWEEASLTRKEGYLNYLRQIILDKIMANQQAQSGTAEIMNDRNKTKDEILEKHFMEQEVKSNDHQNYVYSDIDASVYKIPNNEDDDIKRYSLQEELHNWLNLKSYKGKRLLALLGDFGYGKTTNLQYFTSSLLKQYKPNSNKFLPVYLDMRKIIPLLQRQNLSTDKSPPANLYDIITYCLDIRDDDIKPQNIMNFIHSKNSVVIFDGLDEIGNQVNAGEANRLYKELLGMVPKQVWQEDTKKGQANFKKSSLRLILSCRTHFFESKDAENRMVDGYNKETIMIDENLWQKLYLAPFTIEQVKTWLDKNSKQPDLIYNKLVKIHDLLGMSKNPLLLRLICKILPKIEQDYQQGDIINTAKIYDGLFQEVIERDNITKSLKLTLAEKEEILINLALSLWLKNHDDIKHDKLDKWFSDFGGDLIQHHGNWLDIRQGLLTELHNSNLLVRQGADEFRFAHTSFMEYFVAKALFHSLSQEDEGDIEKEILVKKPLPTISAETRKFFHEIYENADEDEKELLKIRLIGIFKNHDCDRQFWADLWIKGQDEINGLDLSSLNLDHLLRDNMTLLNCDLTGAQLTGLKVNGITISHCNLDNTLMGSGLYKNCHFTHNKGYPDYLSSSKFMACSFSHDASYKDISFAYQCHGLNIPTLTLTPNAKLALKKGHSKPINDLDISPDGTKIVTASDDNTARIFDVKSGACIHVLTAHKRDVNSAEFSPDGTKIVTASKDNTAGIFDVKSGACIHVLTGHEDWVRSAEFSPDDTQILTEGFFGRYELFNAKSGNFIKTLSNEEGKDLKNNWDKDLNMTSEFAIENYDGGVVIIDKKSNKPVKRVWHLPDDGFAVADSDGNIIKSSENAWPYLACEDIDGNGNKQIYPAHFHPDWQNIITAPFYEKPV